MNCSWVLHGRLVSFYPWFCCVFTCAVAVSSHMHILVGERAGCSDSVTFSNTPAFVVCRRRHRPHTPFWCTMDTPVIGCVSSIISMCVCVGFGVCGSGAIYVMAYFDSLVVEKDALDIICIFFGTPVYPGGRHNYNQSRKPCTNKMCISLLG